MNKICVINSYNYERYLEECILSVLNQTVQFDKIFIIDDGSTDGSVDLIYSYAKAHKSIEVIAKENAGQLSCFNVVVDKIENDDQVCFLDADDTYPINYLETLMIFLNNHSYDFTYCSAKPFKNGEEKQLNCVLNQTPPLVWKKTSALVRRYKMWIGSPTSALSVSGSTLKKILPYPETSEWKIRADDIIVYGTSIIGAKKMYIPSLCINYRIHPKSATALNNHWKPKTEEEVATRKNVVNKFIVWLCNRNKIVASPTKSEVYAEYNQLSNQLLSILINDHHFNLKRRLSFRLYTYKEKLFVFLKKIFHHFES